MNIEGWAEAIRTQDRDKLPVDAVSVAKRNAKEMARLAAYWLDAAARERRLFARGGMSMPRNRQAHASNISLARECRAKRAIYLCQAQALELSRA